MSNEVVCQRHKFTRARAWDKEYDGNVFAYCDVCGFVIEEPRDSSSEMEKRVKRLEGMVEDLQYKYLRAN